MALNIENISGSVLDINDLGITLAIGETTDIALRASPDVIAVSANGGDLDSLITGSSIDVKDPIDGTTTLSTADGLFVLRSANEPHYRLTSHRDIDGDTQIWVDDGSVDDDVIRFDVGDAPAGYGAITDVFIISAGGWTVDLGTADTATTAGAPISLTAGTGNTTGAGGDVSITAGNAGATAGAIGGDVIITAGDTIAGGGQPGDIRLVAGTGATTLLGSVISGRSNFATTYNLSVQDDEENVYIEILNQTGAGQGAFFGVENFLTTDDFALYNWQAGPITFYTDTTTSSGERRMVIQPDGDVEVAVKLQLRENAGAGNNLIGFQAAASMSADYDLTFPSAVGASGQVLQTTDASGTLAWVTPAADGDSIQDADGDTQIQVEEGADDDTIRFDVGDTPVGYGAVTDIFTISAAGWTVNMGTANVATTAGAPINITSGVGNTTGAGGAVNITSGAGGDATADGGDVTITGGQGGATSGTGGNITLAAGDGDTDGVVRIPNKAATNAIVIDWDTDGTNSPEFRQESGGGAWILSSDATTVQIIGGSNAAGTTDFFIDCDNNGTLHLNALHTGPVRIGEGGLELEEGGGGAQMLSILAGAAMTSDYTITFPDAAPAADQVLISDGSGNLSWVTPGNSDSATFLLEWRFDTTTTAADPGSKRFRYNNATLASVTEIYVDDEANSGVDASNILGALIAGDKIYIQETGNALSAVLFTVVSVVDNVGWFTITVTVDDDSGVLHGNNNKCAWAIVLGIGNRDKWGSITTDTGGPLVPDSDSDTLTITGGTNMNTAGTAASDTLTINWEGVTIEDEDSAVTNTPHTIINFTGSGVTATDAGSGQVDVTITGGGDVTAGANIVDNSIVRGDGGAKGIQDSEDGTTTWTIADNGQMNGAGDVSGDYIVMIQNLNATSGDGLHVMAGEALGDLVLRLGDADDSFTILEIEADQGHIVQGETYAQTLINNGVVYGYDNQLSATTLPDINTQNGVYRYAGTALTVGDQVIERMVFNACALENPINADWAVNALAPATPDTNNAGLIVRRFDDTTEEGVGFTVNIPADATDMTIRFKSRAETTPGGAVTVIPNLYRRSIPDDGAVSAWSAALALTALDFGTNENFQYDEQTITLATLGLTAGETAQFELTRDGTGTLSGDWTLLQIDISFSGES